MRRLIWEDNIRMGFKEIGFIMRRRIDSTEDRDFSTAVGNVTLNLRVP